MKSGLKRVLLVAVRRWPLTVLAVLCILTGPWAANVILGSNVHEVIPDQVFRTAQLDAKGFRRMAKLHNIRSVVNLRGYCPDREWYQEEIAALDELGVSRYDATFSSELPPSVVELRHLVRVLESCEYPTLIHCRRGADRTGLVAAIVYLLRTDAPLRTARRQLHWTTGHFPLGMRSELGHILGGYQHWLASNEQSHSRDQFIEWVMNHYRPGWCWAEIEPLEIPDQVRIGVPAPLNFRVSNRSHRSWNMCREANTGVHLHLALRDSIGRTIGGSSAGYLDKWIAPDESIDLTIALPAMGRPGRYRLRVDMVDEQRNWFGGFGSRPFESEIEFVP